MREGTKRIFPTDYEKFTSSMIEAANDRRLPVILEMDKAGDFNLKDFHDALFDFNRDTGLELRGSFYYCNRCNRMHTRLEVDWPSAEEGEEPLLQ